VVGLVNVVVNNFVHRPSVILRRSRAHSLARFVTAVLRSFAIFARYFRSKRKGIAGGFHSAFPRFKLYFCSFSWLIIGWLVWVGIRVHVRTK
jgi:hypothetical protein